MINGGQSPIVEQDIGEMLAAAAESGVLSATTDPRAAVLATDISLVCVGTPSQQNGSLDLRFVEIVCREIGEAIREKDSRHTIVMRSTMLPGSMSNVVIPILEEASGMQAGEGFGICNNPEFLREGTAVFDYYNPPKTVIGELEPRGGDLLAEIYKDLDAPMIRTDVNTAEMVKYVDNVWHALKVGFANEIGSIARGLDLDGQEVMRIFCKDEKLNLSPYYLRPGFAFGGSCLPKDTRALTYKASRLDVDVPILSSILPSNERQVQRGIELVRQTGSKKIGVLGFSFKSGTDDLRESPIVELIERLIGKGYELCIYDQYVNLARLVGANKDYILNHVPHIAAIMAADVAEVLDKADVIVIGNGSEEFRDVLSRVRPDQTVIDLVGMAKPDERVPNYVGIGW